MTDDAKAEMGPGRPMGRGWIDVDAGVLDSEDRLTSWVDTALEHNHGRD